MSKRALHNGDHDPGPVPKCITRCRHCTEVFTSIPFPIVGEPPERRHQEFMAKLVNHMATAHAQLFQSELFIPQSTYGTALIGINFSTDDEAFAQHIEGARADAHRRTLRFSLPDSSIEEKVSVLALDPEKQAAVVKLICEMRDVYEERHSFSTRPASGIVIPS